MRMPCVESMPLKRSWLIARQRRGRSTFLMGIGAEPHERTASGTRQREGHRARTLSSTAGDLELRILKLRTG